MLLVTPDRTHFVISNNGFLVFKSFGSIRDHVGQPLRLAMPFEDEVVEVLLLQVHHLVRLKRADRFVAAVAPDSCREVREKAVDGITGEKVL